MNNQSFVTIDAFRRSLQVYSDNFAFLITLSALAYFLPVLNILIDSILPEQSSGISLMLTPAAFAVYVLFFIAMIKAVFKLSLTEPVSCWALIQESYPYVWKGIGGYLVFLAMLFLGMFLLIIPGIYCSVIFYFFIFLQVLENESIIGSFRESYRLVKGNFLTVLKAHGAVILVSAAIFVPIIVGMKLLWIPVAAQKVITTLMGVLTLPLFTGFYYQLYLFLRRPKEGQLKIHEILAPGNTP